ncbi:MAG: zinc-binding dehydrogenase [Gemmatimonadota bacterium]
MRTVIWPCSPRSPPGSPSLPERPLPGRLQTLAGLIEDGKVTPVIDRCCPFADIPAAASYQEKGHARGKVVVTV